MDVNDSTGENSKKGETQQRNFVLSLRIFKSSQRDWVDIKNTACEDSEQSEGYITEKWRNRYLLFKDRNVLKLYPTLGGKHNLRQGTEIFS